MVFDFSYVAWRTAIGYKILLRYSKKISMTYNWGKSTHSLKRARKRIILERGMSWGISLEQKRHSLHGNMKHARIWEMQDLMKRGNSLRWMTRRGDFKNFQSRPHWLVQVQYERIVKCRKVTSHLRWLTEGGLSSGYLFNSLKNHEIHNFGMQWNW